MRRAKEHLAILAIRPSAPSPMPPPRRTRDCCMPRTRTVGPHANCGRQLQRRRRNRFYCSGASPAYFNTASGRSRNNNNAQLPDRPCLGHSLCVVSKYAIVDNNETYPVHITCSVWHRHHRNTRSHALAGISMHKGYAFVQFLNPYDARGACLGEDGRNVLSQVLGECRHRIASHMQCSNLLISHRCEYGGRAEGPSDRSQSTERHGDRQRLVCVHSRQIGKLVSINCDTVFSLNFREQGLLL